MTPHSAAVAAKTFILQQAQQQGPATSDGFAQILAANGLTPLTPNAGSPDQSSNAQCANDPFKSKPANASETAGTPVLGPTQLVPTAPAAKTSSASATTAAAASSGQAGAAPGVTTPLPDAAQPGAPTASSSATGNNGQAANVPPGAAELGARIAVAAPNYLSQPNSALAGLWHHTGNDTADDGTTDSDTNSGDAPTTPSDGAAPATAATAAKFNAAASNALLQSATAFGQDPAATPADLPGATATTQASGDTTQAAAFSSLPGAGDSQTILSSPQTATPAVPTPMHLLPAFEQVAINLKQAAQNGTNRIEIHLKPASLGAIDVKLDVTHDGRITAVISADRSDTLNLLKQDQSGLEQSLRDAGLQADSGSLSFNLRGDAQSQSQNFAAAQNAGGSGNATTTVSSSTVEAPRYRRHDGALDIEV